MNECMNEWVNGFSLENVGFLCRCHIQVEVGDKHLEMWDWS